MSARAGDRPPVVKKEKVTFDSVTRLNPEAPFAKLTHPSVIVFPKGTADKQISRIRFKAKKRQRSTAEDSADAADAAAAEDVVQPPDLHGRDKSAIWKAPPGFNETNTHQFIAIRNRRTGKVRLIQAGATYRLRPHTGALKYTHEESDDDEEMTYAERRKLLLDAFGGRKARLRSTRSRRDRITEDKVDEKTAAQITTMAREMIARDAEKGITHGGEQTTEQSAPPHVSDAQVPHQAYPLFGLMSPAEFTAVEAEAQALLDSTEESNLSIDNPGWRPIVWSLLNSIVKDDTQPDEMRLLRVQAVMYLHYLIVLANADSYIGPKDYAKLQDDMAVTEDILEEIIDRFTSPSSRSTDKRRREKCTGDKTRIANYAILMWVTGKGFKDCDGIESLSVELGVSTKLLVNYAMTMACKVKKQKGGDGYRVTLKAPLVFPPLRKKLNRPQARA